MVIIPPSILCFDVSILPLTNHLDLTLYPAELTPKLVAKAFWTGEVENELRRLELTTEFAFKTDADIDLCMEMIDRKRQTSIYHHPSSDCTPECKERGTGASLIFYNYSPSN